MVDIYQIYRKLCFNGCFIMGKFYFIYFNILFRDEIHYFFITLTHILKLFIVVSVVISFC